MGESKYPHGYDIHCTRCRKTTEHEESDEKGACRCRVCGHLLARLTASLAAVNVAAAIRDFNQALLSVGPLLWPPAEQDQAGLKDT